MKIKNFLNHFKMFIKFMIIIVFLFQVTIENKIKMEMVYEKSEIIDPLKN